MSQFSSVQELVGHWKGRAQMAEARVIELVAQAELANAKMKNAAKTIRTQRMMRRDGGPSAGTEAKLVASEAKIVVSEARVAELEHTIRGKSQRIRELDATVAWLNRSACAATDQSGEGG